MLPPMCCSDSTPKSCKYIVIHANLSIKHLVCLCLLLLRTIGDLSPLFKSLEIADIIVNMMDNIDYDISVTLYPRKLEAYLVTTRV